MKVLIIYFLAHALKNENRANAVFFKAKRICELNKRNPQISLFSVFLNNERWFMLNTKWRKNNNRLKYIQNNKKYGAFKTDKIKCAYI